MATVETKLKFDRWCEAFGIDGERRDRLWVIMLQSGLSPHDEATYFLAASGVLEKVADLVIASNEALPARVEEAAKRAVGPVAEAATAKVEGAHANLAKNLSEVVKTSVTAHLKQVETRRSLGLGGFIVAGGVLCAVAGGHFGWAIGRSDVSGLESRWAALAGRSDSAKWMQLIEANPNLADTLSANCPVGSPNRWSQMGAAACRVPMWLEDVRTPTPAGTVQSTYQSVTEWLASWNMIALVMVSALAGLFGAKAVRTFRALGPIRWLVD